MKYIFLAAGIGTRLTPLTNENPKCLYKLDKETTIIERNISMINFFDKTSEIIVVTGFWDSKIKEVLQKFDNVQTIYNPFFRVTNSIASLWFAKEYLNSEVVIINADVVFDSNLCEDIIVKNIEGAYVLVDSSIKTDGDYNVQIHNDKVAVMSKNLQTYFGEYAGITKLDSCSAKLLSEEINNMINKEHYDQWYENALVQMIFTNNFALKYFDVASYNWTEVDNVDDLLNAKRIHDLK